MLIFTILKYITTDKRKRKRRNCREDIGKWRRLRRKEKVVVKCWSVKVKRKEEK